MWEILRGALNTVGERRLEKNGFHRTVSKGGLGKDPERPTQPETSTTERRERSNNPNENQNVITATGKPLSIVPSAHSLRSIERCKLTQGRSDPLV